MLREGPRLEAAINSYGEGAAGRLSLRTLADYKAYEGYLPAMWRSRKLGTFTRDEITRFHSSLTTGHGKSQANHVLRWLRAVFNNTIDGGRFTGANPVTRLRLNREHARERLLRVEEVDRFLEALAAELPPWSDYFMLLLLTGFRRSALAGLRWNQVNLDTATITLLPGALGSKGKGATIALSRRALEILRSRRDAADESEYVFPRPGNTGHLVEIKSAWARIRKRSGLMDLRTHDLRCTLGSWLTAADAPTALTMKALGHSALAAAQVYQRLGLEPVRAALNQVAQAIPALPPTTEDAAKKLG